MANALACMMYKGLHLLDRFVKINLNISFRRLFIFNYSLNFKYFLFN